MAERYDDDEMIQEVLRDDNDDSETFLEGKTTARYVNKPDAPLTETDFKVLMELTGSADAKDRPGLDLVMVLDVSGSMRKRGRIEHLKTASKFVVKKLSNIDRLSVVKFSTEAKKLCPLRQMTQDAQSEIIEMISGLTTENITDMTKALEEALRVLNGRKLNEGRQVAIMFMSDGDPNPNNADGSQVTLSHVPVYTFGLGQDTGHEVLQKIAERGKMGTFSAIADATQTESSNLSVAFSQCLAGLLSVVVEDLTLTITPKKGNSTIVDVSAGRYQPNEIIPESPVTFSFGNLYSKEIRNILVDLHLEQVSAPKGMEILQFIFSYKVPKTNEIYEANPVIIDIRRSRSASTKENPEVLMELARNNTAAKMKQAMEQADAKDLGGAQATVKEAQKDLQNVDIGTIEPKMKALEAELAQFLKYLDSEKTYETLGRAFALAALLSHSLQRHAAKGDPDADSLYATDAMKLILDQVKEFQKDPDGYKVPTPAEDAQKIKDDSPPPPMPVAPAKVDPIKEIAETLSQHLGQAIQALQAIQEIIEKTRT